MSITQLIEHTIMSILRGGTISFAIVCGTPFFIAILIYIVYVIGNIIGFDKNRFFDNYFEWFNEDFMGLKCKWVIPVFIILTIIVAILCFIFVKEA